jgi:hypothetical protein
MVTTTYAKKSEKQILRLPSLLPIRAMQEKLAGLVELASEGLAGASGIMAFCAFVMGSAFIVYTFLKPWL